MRTLACCHCLSDRIAIVDYSCVKVLPIVIPSAALEYSVAHQNLPLACVARKLQSTTCAKGANTKQAI